MYHGGATQFQPPQFQPFSPQGQYPPQQFQQFAPPPGQAYQQPTSLQLNFSNPSGPQGSHANKKSGTYPSTSANVDLNTKYNNVLD